MGHNESVTNFYNSNALPNNNANMYQTNHVPYQNLPNGQYVHSQLDTRYSQSNTAFPTNLNVPTKSAVDFDKMPMTGKNVNQTQSDSNSDSSSDSDDSNNDSDSSSADSDADNENKENGPKRVIKPFRINLNNAKVSNSFNLLNEYVLNAISKIPKIRNFTFIPHFHIEQCPVG